MQNVSESSEKEREKSKGSDSESALSRTMYFLRKSRREYLLPLRKENDMDQRTTLHALRENAER